MTDEYDKRRAALLEALRRKGTPMRVTPDNIVPAGELVRHGLAEAIEIADELHVRALPLSEQAGSRRGL
ncbi:hypothetical protein [Bradyrhizobium sp. SZCCHNS3053]|uniref:hypothetical protein n=1 Tax=Bradyrhizobium sp. SZCCHNS3053 TaxID=3057322 RepID=UPI00291654BA|nr:hypothetical protein [Bradyrhizobium sp. SZCCHNS3053]